MNLIRAFVSVCENAIFRESNDVPAFRSQSIIPRRIGYGVMPVGPVNLNDEQGRWEREVGPQASDAVLTFKDEPVARHRFAHQSLNARLVAALGKDVIGMFLWVLGVERAESVGVLRIASASQGDSYSRTTFHQRWACLEGQSCAPSSTEFQVAQHVDGSRLSGSSTSHLFARFFGMPFAEHRVVLAASTIRSVSVGFAYRVGSALNTRMVDLRQSLVPYAPTPYLSNERARSGAVAFSAQKGRRDENGGATNFARFRHALIAAHRLRYSSTMRRVSSATVIPRRLASAFKNFICGSVKEIICSYIPSGYHRVSTELSCY